MSGPAPVGESEFELDDAADESIPLVATELLPPPAAPAPAMQANPFEDLDYYATSESAASLLASMEAEADAIEVPTTSIEIPLPAGLLDSLPVLGEQAPATTVARPPSGPPPERRSNDGLVKEVSIPLNLSMDELRQHRRLRLKITLDVNLLP